MDCNPITVVGGGNRRHVQIDGCRKDAAMIVVGVVATEFGSAGSTEKTSRTVAESADKFPIYALEPRGLEAKVFSVRSVQTVKKGLYFFHIHYRLLLLKWS
jgi:hypothetical protein